MKFDPQHWLTVVALAVLVLTTPVLALFHDDAFYHFCYERNSAYESLGEENVWTVTENFQAFLDGKEELRFFDEQQASHLLDVKDIVNNLETLWYVLFFMSAAALFLNKKAPDALRDSAKVSIIILAVLVVLAVNWQWFFTQFHHLLFDGNWTFPSESLMIRMWGGGFFIYAAAYSALLSVLLSLLFYTVGKVLQKTISPR